MAGEAAVDGDAEKTLLDAEILVAIGAVAALAAADPREYRLPGADQAAWNIGTDLRDDAGDLVSQREGQGHAAGGVKFLAAAEIGVAVLDMQVGMAQPAALDPDQHFPGYRLRRLHDGFAQRGVEFDQ